ncbi:coagulation factor 5/8 type [Nocardioides szechwanensis]|uniref:Arabinofuranan 3-O-arabinosyltransferase n=1 Tax=Nocardioides szechwanensis TaxID=1005944 RepID=A0A1G9VQJ3_9ACTN|nr:alpha-(1->3)-arabinofuranosyltransferase family protein [Nocardioides szechwanensis]GEP32861.1 coagulation factor 5/8 type [Nocardioides szechwanensis]SDM74426.1 arabinofuranan 3-O-arabinosyltransferase [Nocardioides szechwanensis]
MSGEHSATDGPAGVTGRQRHGWVTVGIVALVMVLNVFQQPGLVTFDTKLDLQFNPAGFIDRSLSLWNADWAIGGLQNQASGFLFPMGPAFLLGDALGLPMWLWERLWSAAVMLLAYGGARRLASYWPGVTRWGAVVAGLTYMLAPRVLTTVGTLSGEALPAAVLPWTVLPLVLYLRGRLHWAVALLWSGASVSWMGGQNATLVLACLVFPGLLLALGEGRTWRRRVRDVTVWSVLVLLASLWWLVPLFLLGGYGPPFLDFIESATNTASVTGWLSSLRGTSHWVAFLPDGGGAGLSGGHALARSPVLLLTTVAVAGLGLLGLAQAGLWQRRVLMVSLLAGMFVLTVGTGGWAGSVLSGAWIDALDTWLAPLRNVHKFDPLVRLPLSLGVGGFVSVGLPRLLASSPRPVATTRPVRAALAGVVAALVAAAALPAISGQLRTEGGAEDISTSWRQAAAFLSSEPGPVSAIVLPGAGVAAQYWGRTIDEPIQVLDAPPWISRAQVTVAPAGTLRYLDSIERLVEAGRPQAGLVDAIRRLGVTHVVVRNDLDDEETDAPPAEAVYASLGGDPDVVSVARFGQTAAGEPEVEVLSLGGGARDPRAGIAEWADLQVVQGGPEVVSDLVADGLLGADQPTVLAEGEDGETVDILTDSNRRVERTFGRVHSAVSGVMTAGDDFRFHRPVHDYVGGSVPAATTTAEYDGAEQLRASSSGGYADVFGPVRPEEHPYAAFDDSAFTAWASAPFSPPEDQWIEAQFDRPVDPGQVELQFDVQGGAQVSVVRLTTDDGEVTVPVPADGRTEAVNLPGTRTTRVRMTVVEAATGRRQVRLAGFVMSDHRITRSLRLPGKATPQTTVHLSSEAPERACRTTSQGVACSQGWQRETSETPGFDRTFDVVATGEWRLAGRVVATHGRVTEQLLTPLSPAQVTVVSTTTFAGDPAVGAAQAFDGLTDTGWYASPLDPAPGLQLSWQRKRVITGIRAVLRQGQEGYLPEFLRVDPMTPDGATQLVATTGPRAGVMTPIRTQRLNITALVDPSHSDGVGISELEIDGLEDLRHTPDPTAATGVPCGFGPTIEVGGATFETGVTGTIGDVVTGAPLDLQVCGDDDVVLHRGAQRLKVTNAEGFAVSSLWLTPSAPTVAVRSAPPTSEVTSWSSSERVVEVDAEEEAVLVLPQSYNRGWRATVDGRTLDSVVLDGWKQGWRVPAGTDGVVEMSFEPQDAFRLSLVLGLSVAALLALLTLMTLALSRRRPERFRGSEGRPPAPARRTAATVTLRVVGLLVGGLALAVMSVPLLAGAAAGHVTRRAALPGLSVAVGSALLFAVLIAIADPAPVMAPPPASDAIVALVVGLVAGRMLSGQPEGVGR